MNIQLYKSFNKKHNSTKQPTGTPTTKAVTLKEKTSVLKPTFILSNYDASYNYLYVPDWARYYYITDVSLNITGLFEITCSCDVLASYKTQIGATSAYILRCASRGNNSAIDGMYPMMNDIVIDEISCSGLFATSVNSGSFVLGVVGAQTNSLKHGSVTYYAMNETMLRDMCDVMFSDSVWQQLKNDYENPLDCIVSCYWIPYQLTGSGSSATIKFGKYELEGTSGYVITQHVYSKYVLNKSIPKHPQVSRGVYLNSEPYSTYTFYCTPFGNIPLPAVKLTNETTLSVTLRIDVISGQGALEFEGGSGKLITKVFGQVGVPVALSQNTISMGSVIGAGLSGLGAIGSIAAGNVMGGIVGGVGAINNLAGALSGNEKTQGSNGSFLSMVDDGVLRGTFARVVTNDTAHLGKPLCTVATINTLSGYVLCKEARVDIAGYESEKTDIDGFLNSGFYYE